MKRNTVNSSSGGTTKVGVSGWLKKGKGTSLGNFELMKDPEKEKYQNLSEEYDRVSEEYKKLRSFIDNLETDYHESKRLDFIRRYLSMKGMVKRTILHLKLPNLTSASQSKSDSTGADGGNNGATTISAMGGLITGTRTFVKRTEQAKKREERLQNLNPEDLVSENRKLEESIKEYRRKCGMITNAIENLDDEYNAAKIYFPLRRYTALKMIVKRTINDQLIRET